MRSEIHQKLTDLAFKRSITYCYACYKEVPTGRCESCGSDDNMRLLPGVGCECGTEWIIESILESELTPVDLDEEFEEYVQQCHPDIISVGWMSLDPVAIMKAMDPVSWSCAQSEWESQEADEGTIISFDYGSTYYRREDIEGLLEDEAK